LKLYLMRHGPAEEQADSGMDSDRALTASGRDRVRSVAKLLLELDEQPLQVITSPLARAVQTAEIVALVTRLGDRQGNVQVRRELSPGGGDGAGLIASLASAGSKRVMLVGHEPDMSELTAKLIAKGSPRPFEKAMVVGLQVGASGDHSRLRFVLDPKALGLDPDLRGSAP
jgi:phosphohistidine phosphatase